MPTLTIFRFNLIIITLLYSFSSRLYSQEDDKLETVTLATYYVTGSQLTNTEETYSELVSTITAEELELWSDLNPVSALRRQTFSFGNSNTENDSNSGTGSAGANIRGLGNLSTLTLINGRRAGGNSAYGFQHGGFADLNLIPSAAIREIEIATEGTSVAYGSDAVAGTVNLLLYDAYLGNRIDATYSNTTEEDASEKLLSFLGGYQITDQTRVVLLGNWYQRNAIFARDRNISDDADRRDQGGLNQGSPTFPGRINVAGIEYVLNDGVTEPASLADYRVWNPTEDLYNFSEAAPAIPETERKSLMANITHDLNDQVEIWTELLYSQTEFLNGAAPAPWSGSFFPNTLIIDAAGLSPHLPAGIAPTDLAQVNYRSFELGTLDFEQEKEAFRGLAGIRGEVAEWNWETAVLFIKTDLEETFSGVSDATILSGLIESGAFNPFATAFATGTIPSGPLAGETYDNAAALREAAVNPVNNYDEEFLSYDFKVNGDLFELPSGPLETVFGIEYRNEDVDTEIDALFESGFNLGGVGQESYSAEREVRSVFAEALVPLIRTGEQKLDLGLSARYEHYEDDPAAAATSRNRYETFVYKASLFYQLNSAVRLYGSYGTSFRAPTLSETFGGSIFASFVYDDPLGPTPDAARVLTEIRSNPDLDPEESENINLGIVFEPQEGTGWRASVEYYRIDTEDAIVTSAQDVVNDPFGAVFRDGAGNLFFVQSDWLNAAERVVDGIEYELSYLHPYKSGYWEAKLGINQVFTYDIKTSSDGETISFLGRLVDPRASNESVAGPGSIPRYKGYASMIWNYQGLTIGGMLNYIHSLDDNAAFTTDGEPREVDSWLSLDLVASYEWSDSGVFLFDNTKITLGIENVTDEAPPFAAGAFADGYDSSLYSLEGRRISLSMSRKF
ncbi:MAG: TonB-dependent receptor [Verrucomicrobiota bacterium]